MSLLQAAIAAGQQNLQRERMAQDAEEMGLKAELYKAQGQMYKAQSQKAQFDIQRAMGKQQALDAAMAGDVAAQPASDGISQASFGPSAASQQAEVESRYGPQAPNGVNLHAGLGTSTAATVQTPPAQKPFMFKTGKGETFDKEATAVAQRLEMNPQDLQSIMGFETGGTFDPAVRNKQSGATGLLQFLPKTAIAMGTTVEALAKLSPEEQLAYVERYLQPYKGRIGNLQDAYMAVLYPEAIGKPADYKLFELGEKAYAQNKGLDKDKKGYVTVADATNAVRSHASNKGQADTSTMTASSSEVMTDAQPAGEQLGLPQGMPQAPASQAEQPAAQPREPQALDPDLVKLRRVAEAYMRHDEPEMGLKLLGYVETHRQGREIGQRVQELLKNPNISEAQRNVLLAGVGQALAKAGKFDEAFKLVEERMPLTERELLKGASERTKDKYLARGGTGSAAQAAREAEAERGQENAARFSEVIEAEDGTKYLLDKRTGKITMQVGGPASAPSSTQTQGQPAGDVPVTQPGESSPSFRKPMSENQGKAFTFGSAGLQGHDIVTEMENRGILGSPFLPRYLESIGEEATKIGAGLGATAGATIGIFTGGFGALPGGIVGSGAGAALGNLAAQPIKDLANAMRSPEEQQMFQAKSAFINAILRRESGAAIGAGEYDRYDRQFFGQPGDSPQVVRQKQQDRALRIATLAKEAGRPLATGMPSAPAQTPAQHGVRETASGEQVRIEKKRGGWNTTED